MAGFEDGRDILITALVNTGLTSWDRLCMTEFTRPTSCDCNATFYVSYVNPVLILCDGIYVTDFV